MLTMRHAQLFMLAIIMLSALTLPSLAQAGATLPLAFYGVMAKECLICDTVSTLVDTSFQAMIVVFDSFSGTFFSLLVAVLMVWIAIQAVKLVAPADSAGNSRGIYMEMMRRVFITVVALAILSSAGKDNIIINGLAVPTMNAGLRISEATMTAVSNVTSRMPGAPAVSSPSNTCSVLYPNKPKAPVIDVSNAPSGSDQTLWQNIYCHIFVTQRAYGSVMALGYGFMYMLVNAIDSNQLISDNYVGDNGALAEEKTILDLVLNTASGTPNSILPKSEVWSQILSLTGLLYGLVIFGLYFYLVLRFLFYMISFVIRFAFVVAMMPLIIVAYVFPSFRGAATASFAMLLNSVVGFWVQSIVISLGVYLIYVMSSNAFPASITAGGALLGITDGATIISHILQNVAEGNTSGGGVLSFYDVNVAFATFLVGGLLIGFLMRLGSNLADEMVQAAMSGARFAGLGTAFQQAIAAVPSSLAQLLQGNDTNVSVTTNTTSPTTIYNTTNTTNNAATIAQGTGMSARVQSAASALATAAQGAISQSTVNNAGSNVSAKSQSSSATNTSTSSASTTNASTTRDQTASAVNVSPQVSTQAGAAPTVKMGDIRAGGAVSASTIMNQSSSTISNESLMVSNQSISTNNISATTSSIQSPDSVNVKVQTSDASQGNNNADSPEAQLRVQQLLGQSTSGGDASDNQRSMRTSGSNAVLRPDIERTKDSRDVEFIEQEEQRREVMDELDNGDDDDATKRSS